MNSQRDGTAALPDLSGFESASSGGRGLFVAALVGWFVITVTGAAVCAAIAVALSGLAWPDRPMAAVFFPSMAGFALLLGAWLARRDWFNWRLETDSDGLTIWRLFSKRQVSWSQVTDASSVTGMSGNITYSLKTAAGTVAVSDPLQSTSASLNLSVFHHLRKLGKLEAYQAPKATHTLLEPIPDNVPAEIDWHNPKPPNWSITAVVMICLVLAIPAVILIGRHFKALKDFGFLSHGGNAIVLGIVALFRERLIVAKNASVRQDGLEIRTGRRLLFLRWTEIGHAHWDAARKTFAIGRSKWSDVGAIPFRPSDPDSGLMILAIIRQLRAAHHNPPVAVPPVLLPLLALTPTPSAHSFRTGDEAVELRPIRARMAITMVSVIVIESVLFMVLPTLLPLPRLFVYALIASNVIILPVLVAHALRVYRADSEGVSLTSPIRRQTVNWREVAAYIVQRSDSGITRRTLKDSSGGTLMSFAFIDGVRPETDRFTAFVDAQLASVRQDNVPRMMR